MLTDLLAVDEHHVQPARDARSALDRLSESVYDIVLTNLRMPLLSGIDLYRRIVERDGGMEGRVAFLADVPLNDVEQAFFDESERCLLLRKPFQLEEIRDIITRLLAAPAVRSREEAPVAL
jgi:CheY-like chemotaxis protein